MYVVEICSVYMYIICLAHVVDVSSHPLSLNAHVDPKQKLTAWSGTRALPASGDKIFGKFTAM